MGNRNAIVVPLRPRAAWTQALKEIQHGACRIDRVGRWPTANIRILHAAGALGWSIPRRFGGRPLGALALHQRYEQLAAVCLASALILTQRDAALEFLACVPGNALAEKLLRQAAANRVFLTIGIAQLTTSGQHDLPRVTARQCSGGWIISGVIPWATGAHHADWIVAGATLADNNCKSMGISGGQLLFLLSTRRRGVTVLPADKLSTLNATGTAPVRLKSVRVLDGEILAGPAANVLSVRQRQKRFSLNTCILPLGVAGGALAMAGELAMGRSAESRRAVDELRRRLGELRATVYAVGTGRHSAGPDSTSLAVEADLQPTAAPDKTSLRAAANVVCGQAALAALELAKGRGLSLHHAAQRRARESHFFFVWSSPSAVIDQTLAMLAGLTERLTSDNARSHCPAPGFEMGRLRAKQ